MLITQRNALRLSALIAIGFLGWLIPGRATASVALTTRIIQGGMDLDLGRVETGRPVVTRELELTLTNSASSQYRLYQESSGFLVNERGTRLPEGAVIFQISGGSSGTPSTGAISPLIEAPQEIYVSNAQGASDSVIVAYSVAQGSAAWMAGNYRGNLRFTVEDRDSGARTTEIVQLRLTVVAVARLERAVGAPSRLLFGEVEPAKQSTPIELPFNIVNNAAAAVILTQEIAEPLIGDQGQFFPSEALTFMFSSEQKTLPWQAVSEHPERVFSGHQGALSNGRLAYAVAAPQGQRAGTYRGKLRIRLMGDAGAAVDEWLLPIELKVREIFTVSVEIVNGSDAMHFLKDPGGGNSERVMRLTVNTNTGKPYQVLGGLDHPLVLPSGETLPAASLTWSVQEVAKGRSLVKDYGPVAIGFEPIFVSDAAGSSESFLLLYHMDIPPDARDGLYSASMHFTVTVS